MSKKNKKIVLDEDFDCSKDNQFIVKFDIGNNHIVDEKLLILNTGFTEKNLTYDDVVDKAYDEFEKEYSPENFPNVEITEIMVFSTDENAYVPVFAESQKKEISECKKSKKYNRFLVLPEGTYSLSPECRLWMGLKDAGEIPDDAPFNYEKYHAIVESLVKTMNEEK